MEHSLEVVQDPAGTIATIEQKALRLSALLREIDNHPAPLSPQASQQLDQILEQLCSRVHATHALIRQATSARSDESQLEESRKAAASPAG